MLTTNNKLEIKPFIIVKPDGARYLKEIQKTINDNNFQIEDRFLVNDWEKLATELYKNEFKTKNDFNIELEATLWITKVLFGNNALLITLSNLSKFKNLDILATYGDIIKKEFRSLNSDLTDQLFSATVKIECVQNKFSNFRKSKSNYDINKDWIKCYFNHIHAPDPCGKILRREWKILNNCGIIKEENYVEIHSWKIMQQYQSLYRPLV